MKHTPGEWSKREVKHPYGKLIRIEPKGSIFSIAEIFILTESKRKGEEEANALLISQAPALLQALKDCRQALIDCGHFTAESIQVKAIDLQIEKATK